MAGMLEGLPIENATEAMELHVIHFCPVMVSPK
jgi:hypothetical protein